MAASKKSMEINRSQALFQEACQYIPGGVNSPARAFRSVGGNPRFIARAEGPWLYDEDGNRYLDLINSWGPMILGHAHPDIIAAAIEAIHRSSSFGAPTAIEIEMAKAVTQAVPSIQKLRMVNSGTEATMSAVRVARGYTGREKLIKFEGCYHGHGDSFLIAAGSGLMTQGIPDSAGITEGTSRDTLTAPYNDLAAVQALVTANPDQIAAIILEPVVGNMGVIVPEPGFLQGLRDLCDAAGIVLIFDEVMTGFRLAYGGAQALYGIQPDMTTLGKIIGGGMPVGAYGGKAEIMDKVAPLGPVYQAGTLSGNPVAMAAGITMLRLLREDHDLYQRLERNTAAIEAGALEIFREKGIPVCINRVGSMITLFFAEGPIRNFTEAKRADTQAFGQFFRNMLGEGVYLPPSQFEAAFISDCIQTTEIDHILSAIRKSI
jgi:glutamate-1-semialdehyde 2,1-aminomutase